MVDLSTTAEDYGEMTLAEMEARNRERIADLARQRVEVNPGTAYIEAMLETLLGDDLPRARALFQVRLGKQLDSVEGQVLRARLGVR